MTVEPAGTDVDIYLIGHSLGGVVALGYLESLEQGGLLVSLPAHAHLKAVITLDSPIGGVSQGFLTDATALGTYVLEQQCPAAKGQTFTAPKNLETIFNSASITVPPKGNTTVPQGAQASILEAATDLVTLPSPLPSNQSLVDRAKADLGTSFLSIGNLYDFVFDPNACSTPLPSFLDTQFLTDEGDRNGVYGREFVSGKGTCPGLFDQKTKNIVTDNHNAVLSDKNVQLGITNFLAPLINSNVGGTPSPLPINPFQSSGS